MFKQVFQWFVYSSKDPSKYALTLKGAIPFLVLLKVGDVDTLGIAFDAIVNFVMLTGTWVAGAITAYGALRKVYLSLPFVKR